MAGGITLSQALTAKLAIDIAEYQAGMTKAEKRAQQAREKMGNAFKATAAAVALVGGAALAVAKKIFDIGSAAIETQSKFNTTFGTATRSVQAVADSLGTMAGLTRSAAQDALASTGAMVQGMGFTQEASAKLSTQVLQLAGDFTSFNNVPIADTLRAIRSAIVGETEPLKRLGIVLRQSDVEHKALMMTGKTVADTLTQQEKATATLALITERAGPALGDLARTQDSIANRTRAAMAQLGTLKETLAVQLVPIIARAVIPELENLIRQINENRDRILAFGIAAVEVGKTMLGLAKDAFALAGGVLGDTAIILMEAGKAIGASLAIVRGDMGEFIRLMAMFDPTLFKTAFVDLKDVVGANMDAAVTRVQGLADALTKLPDTVKKAQAAAAALQVPTTASMGGTVSTLAADTLAQIRAAGGITKESTARAIEAALAQGKLLAAQIGEVTEKQREATAAAMQFADAWASNVAGAIVGVVTGVQSVGQAVANLGRQILSEIVGALIKAIARAIVLRAIMGAFGGGFLPMPRFFQRGGMLSAQGGMMLPSLAPAGMQGGIPILAHRGEAVLNREAVSRIGGAPAVQRLNAASQGTGGIRPAPETGSGGVQIGTVNLSLPNVTDAATFGRELRIVLAELQRKGKL